MNEQEEKDEGTEEVAATANTFLEDQQEQPLVNLPVSTVKKRKRELCASNNVVKLSDYQDTNTTTTTKRTKRKTTAASTATRLDSLQIVYPQVVQKTPKGNSSSASAVSTTCSSRGDNADLEYLKKNVTSDNVLRAGSCAVTRTSIIDGVKSPSLNTILRDLVFTKPNSLNSLSCYPSQYIKAKLDRFDVEYSKILKQLLISSEGNDNHVVDTKAVEAVASSALQKYFEDLKDAYLYRTIYIKSATKLCQVGRQFDSQFCIVFNDRLQKLPLGSITNTAINNKSGQQHFNKFFNLARLLRPEVQCLLNSPHSISNCAQAIIKGDKSCQDRLRGASKTPTVNQFLKEQTTTLGLLKKLGTNY